jgi:outer membrane protein TolC
VADASSPDLATRPDLQQAQVLIQARRAEVDAAHAASHPQLNLTSAAGWDTGDLPSPANAGGAVGFDVAWPFFTSGAIGAQAQQAELGARRAELELAHLTQQARLSLSDARAQLRKAETQLDALARARELANRSLEMARFGFREGSLPYLAVLTAQRAAIDARVAEQNARYDAALAQAHLRLALGQTP